MNQFSKTINEKFDIEVTKHADTILRHDFPEEWEDVTALLEQFTLKKSWIVKPGGRKSKIAEAIDSFLYPRGWQEKQFNTQIITDGESRDNPTHKIDCFKNRIAFEVEWNNKTEFYDRDLSNFRILNELGNISIGIILTRATSLNEVLFSLRDKQSYGASTTHMDKLMPRLGGGSAGGCPIIAMGITAECYDKNG